jgi:hypothetical protein
MKKIVKLTESELKKVLKKIIKESLLLESPADSLNRGKLESTYTTYNNLGSEGTFNEIFKNEREQGLPPFNEFFNGCATKVSLAINAAGGTLKPTFRVTNGLFKGKYVNLSAIGLKNELLGKWGKPDVKIDNVTSLEEIQQKIGPGRSGVFICAPCGSGFGATGHATIWSWWKNGLKGGPLDDSTFPEENGGTISFWGVGGTNVEVATKCGYSSWDEYEKSNFKCKTD